MSPGITSRHADLTQEARSVDLQGLVQVDQTKVSTKKTAEGTLLFRSSDANLVRLTGTGAALWSRITGGQHEVKELIRSYQEEAEIPIEKAAYDVINFLDALRAERLISFDLTPTGASGAPLLDVSLEPPPQIEFMEASGGEPGKAPKTVVLNVARTSITLAEIIRIAQETHGLPASEVRTIRAVDLTPAEIEPTVLRQLAAAQPSSKSSAARRFFELTEPSDDLTLAAILDQQRLARDEKALGFTATITITTDDWTITVGVSTDPHPFFGKSRSACQTACV